MTRVWVCGDSIISPLGENTRDNVGAILRGTSGLKQISVSKKLQHVVAGRIDSIQDHATATRFEQLCLKAIEAIPTTVEIPKNKTLLVLSTTKGNIAELSRTQSAQRRLKLHEVGNFLSNKTGISNNVVVSNACISGIVALIVAKRYLANGKFDHAIVVGSDELSDFVISGFQSLQALSDEVCRPFDSQRKGINLGEASAAILLSAKPSALGITDAIEVLGSAITNDANHISGPSRTGEELADAISKAMESSGLAANNIDFISGHGTATIFNDEMEAKALNLAGLADKPINSLKGYYGHTLGAAGVVESVVGLESLRQGAIVSTFGYENSGVSRQINVTRENIYRPVSTFMKTASGFGGCNAAIVFQKSN